MKWIALGYILLAYLVSCADDTGSPKNSSEHLVVRTVRVVFWPITLNSWFRKQPIQLHRFLNLLWVSILSGWLLSLLADRIH